MTLRCPACTAVASRLPSLKKGAFEVVRCPTCGLGRTLVSDFDPKKYYTEKYFDGSLEDGYANYVESESVLRAEFARTVSDLVKFSPAGGRLLEIGCAYGFFLLEARKHFAVVGLEVSESAVRFCQKAGLDVHEGVADENTLGSLGRFDAAVMLDVIEHLPAPVDTLGLLAQQLNPGGVIMITTGDFGSWVARAFGRKWRLMTPPQHLWFFTRRSFEETARRLGLELVDYQHPWKRVPVSLIVFQLCRLIGLGKVKVPFSRALGGAGIPINLFDAMRVVLRKPTGLAVR